MNTIVESTVNVDPESASLATLKPEDTASVHVQIRDRTVRHSSRDARSQGHRKLDQHGQTREEAADTGEVALILDQSRKV